MLPPVSFTDKNVVFVGPAPNLIDRALGKQIEQADIVVKSGPAVHIDSDSYFRDYGRRIDVLYCNEAFCRGMDKLDPQTFIDRGIKMLKVRFRGPQFYWAYAKHMHVAEIDPQWVVKIFPGSLPLMGTIALLDILKEKPARLFFTGVDFNASRGLKNILVPKPNNYDEYYPGYIGDELKGFMDKLRKHNARDAHNSFNDARLFWQMLETGRVDTHDFIKNTLQDVLAAEIA